MVDLSKYILDLKTSKTIEDALDIFNEGIKELGFDYYFLSNLNAIQSPAIFKIKFFQTTYPEEWMKIYMEQQYFFHDPIAIAVIANNQPFYWTKYMKSHPRPFSDEAKRIMEHATEHNIYDGVGMSYLLNQGNLYTITLSTDKVFEEYDYTILAQAYLLGSHLVNTCDTIAGNKVDDVVLTEQEKKIVTLGAIGKTDGEMAQILGLSVNTVRYHWKNIFEKLQSYSRVFAIIQAMNLGFVDPSIFEMTTESGSSEKYQRNV